MTIEDVQTIESIDILINKEGFEFANKYMETNAVQEVMDSKSVSNRQIDSCVKLL